MLKSFSSKQPYNKVQTHLSSFICVHCGGTVSITAPGTRHRNHCPFCLYSVHLDKGIGDRLSDCGGIMVPIGKTFKKDGEEMVVHKCEICGVTRKNRIAGDDSFEEVAKLTEVTF